MIDVKGLYKKYASGERLTYDERSAIVSFDKSVSVWDKINIRIDALYELRAEGESVLDEIANFEALLRSGNGVSDFLSKEYYDMSTKEKPSSRVSSDKKEPTSNKMKEIQQSFQDLKDYSIEDERPVPAFNGYDDDLGIESFKLEGKRNSDGSYSFNSKTKGEFENTDFNKTDTFGFNMNVTDTELQLQVTSNNSLNQLSNDKVMDLNQSEGYKIPLNQLSETEMTQISKFLNVTKKQDIYSFKKFESQELVNFVNLIDSRELTESKRTERNRYLDPFTEYEKFTQGLQLTEKEFKEIQTFDEQASNRLKIDMRKAILTSREVNDQFYQWDKRNYLETLIDNTDELTKFISSEYDEMKERGFVSELDRENNQDLERYQKLDRLAVNYQVEFDDLIDKCNEVNNLKMKGLESEIANLESSILNKIFKRSEIKNKRVLLIDAFENEISLEDLKSVEANFFIGVEANGIMNTEELGNDISEIFKNKLISLGENLNQDNLSETMKSLHEIFIDTEAMQDQLFSDTPVLASIEEYVDSVKHMVDYDNHRTATLRNNNPLINEGDISRYPMTWRPQINRDVVREYLKENLIVHMAQNASARGIDLNKYLEIKPDFNKIENLKNELFASNDINNPDKFVTVVDNLSIVANQDFDDKFRDFMTGIEKNFSQSIFNGKFENPSLNDSNSIGITPEIQIDLGNQTIKSVGKTESQKNGNAEININMGDSVTRSDLSSSMDVNTGVQQNVQVNTDSTKSFTNTSKSPEVLINRVNSKITNSIIGKDNGRGRE